MEEDRERVSSASSADRDDVNVEDGRLDSGWGVSSFLEMCSLNSLLKLIYAWQE